MTTREAAIFAGNRSKSGWRTINRWIRKGLVPRQFYGGGKEFVVKPEGIDIALRKICDLRLKRLGIKIKEVA